MDEKTVVIIPYAKIQPFYCRICVLINNLEYDIHEIDANDGQTVSLYTMLERLVPSVFNAAQMELDESMNWPKKICIDCRRRVLDAYELYQLCINSEKGLKKCISQSQNIDMFVDDMEATEHNYAGEVVLEVVIKCEDGQPVDSVAKKECQNTVHVESSSIHDAPSAMDETDELCRSPEADERSSYENENDSAVEQNLPITTTRRIRRSANANKTKMKSERTKLKGKRKTNASRKAQDSVDQKPDTEELETKVDLYRCQLCEGPTYTSPKELNEHLLSSHPAQIRTCELCTKVFMNEQTFQHHQYCHATGRSHFCTFCDKGFQTQQLLKNHIRTHTHGTGFLCFHCGQEFSNRSNLRQHLVRHSGDKPWACDQCPSRFSMKSYLVRHQHTHTKTKQFECSTCGSGFNRHYSLIKHQLIHTGERFFACEVCKMKFISNHHLKRHILTHTGEKPFKCTYCDRGFAQSNDMVKHMKTHVGNNPYQCDRCEESFRLLTDLRNHYKKHYQAAGASAADESKGIRFTSTDILKMRYEKEMNQFTINNRNEDSSTGEATTISAKSKTVRKRGEQAKKRKAEEHSVVYDT